MSDLLEPFRRAAELGFRRFRLSGKKVLWLSELGGWIPVEECLSDELRCQSIAAVCECWWREWSSKPENKPLYGHHMIDLCREFGRKHGGQ